MLGLYFLGTSSGVPTKERNVTGIAVTLHESTSWVLVDCGEGTQHQVLESPLSLISLKAILITHVHGDHCYGLPGLIASMGMAGRTEPLTVVGPEEIECMYFAVKDCSQLFVPFEVTFVRTESMGTYVIGDTEITATALSHRVPSHAFCFVSSSRKNSLLSEKLVQAGIVPGPVWGQLQQGNDVELANGEMLKACDFVEVILTQKSIVVAGDNDDPSLLADIVVEADVLVHESTYTDEILQKVGPEPQHSSAGNVAAFAQESGIPNLVLTHFSARFQRKAGSRNSIDEIEAEARNAFSGTLFLANDHDEFVFCKSGKLIKKANREFEETADV